MNKRRWLLVGLCSVAVLLTILLALVLYQRQEAARQNCRSCEAQTEQTTPAEELKRLTIGFIRRELPAGHERSLADEEAMPQRLAETLTRVLGIPVRWLQIGDEDALLSTLQEKQIDIGLFHPLEIVQSSAIPLLQTQQEDQTARRTEFIVPAGSPLTSLGELLKRPDLRWAFDTRNSDYGFLYPATQLMKQSGQDEVPPFQLLETKHYESAITAVLDGNADFATVREGGREIMLSSHPYLLERTKVLATTDPLPLEIVGMRPEITERWRDKVKAALLSLSHEESTDLQAIFNCSGFTELNAEQYNNAKVVARRLPLLLQNYQSLF